MKKTPKIELEEMNAAAIADMKERKPEFAALDADIAAAKKAIAAGTKQREKERDGKRKRNAQLKQERSG